MAIGRYQAAGKGQYEDHCFYLLTTAIAITVAILLASLINPGTGAGYGEDRDNGNCCGGKAEHGGYPLQIIPTNPLGALASGRCCLSFCLR